MEENYSVSFSKIIEKFALETIYMPDLPENLSVSSTRVNRPGLQMVGFYDHFEKERLQIIGRAENDASSGTDGTGRAEWAAPNRK